jgi:hypothetical protein
VRASDVNGIVQGKTNSHATLHFTSLPSAPKSLDVQQSMKPPHHE